MAELEAPLPRRERRANRRPLPLPEVKFVPAGNPSLPTFVSLMLMITTFMIVLTSISLHENTRMRALMSSVRETFSTARGEASAGTASDIRAKLLGEAATGFKRSVPLAVIDAAAGGSALVLTVPLSAVLDTTAGAATADFANGMAVLTAALARRPAELAYEVELRFDDPALATAHATALATAAVRAGLDAGHLFVGAGPGMEDNLTILVQLDPPAATENPAPADAVGAP